ncbi:MAG: formate/nitrite transporter family protein [Anaerolineae bacterium]|nr:formate/nitrite transporter family protein [Anaerolineae bacterium]
MAFRKPAEIVAAAEAAACSKASLSIPRMLVLGFLAGAYIAVGGLIAIVVGKGSPALAAANPGLAKFLFAAVFPVGIIIVVIAGSELFTGNCSVFIPGCLSGRTSWLQMLRNWAVVYVGNLIGSLFVAIALAYLTNIVHGGALGEASAGIAEAKVNMGFWARVLRGIGCNWLVGLGIWLAIAADDVTGKILGLWFPIMTFVAVGFEHSVANMFFIPLGMLNGANVNIAGFVANLIPVTLGNIIGGSVLVGGIYGWLYGSTAEDS